MARYFFDTSALVKRYHAESGSSEVRRLLTEPGADCLISRLATVEMLSGFAGEACDRPRLRSMPSHLPEMDDLGLAFIELAHAASSPPRTRRSFRPPPRPIGHGSAAGRPPQGLARIGRDHRLMWPAGCPLI
jgi:hypothetical protein